MLSRLRLPRVWCGIFAAAWLELNAPVLAAPGKWAAAINTLTKADATHPPAPNGVLFVGSSSIAKWKTLVQDFPNVPVINRGFGGSELADSVFFADRIVLPYQPRLVVVYAGENNLWAGKTAEAVAADFKALRAKIHAARPATRILYLSIKESPSRHRIKTLVLRANRLIAADCATDQRCQFVDVATPMLDPAGRPRPELFVADQLHLNPAGYAIWTGVLAPFLKP